MSQITDLCAQGVSNLQNTSDILGLISQKITALEAGQGATPEDVAKVQALVTLSGQIKEQAGTVNAQ